MCQIADLIISCMYKLLNDVIILRYTLEHVKLLQLWKSNFDRVSPLFNLKLAEDKWQYLCNGTCWSVNQDVSCLRCILLSN